MKVSAALALGALAALACVSLVSAECANACSGHGRCSTSDQCDCFPNYRAADCSERVCPYGLAWVDSPRGDLNHDGIVSGVTGSTSNHVPLYSFGSNVWYDYESFPNDNTAIGSFPAATGKKAQNNEGHFYSECSNKGLCDRELGQCVCFDGYTGSSCQRTVCPNSCSGHGVCRTVEEIAAGALNYKKTDNVARNTYWQGVQTAGSYSLWDRDMAQSCVCDAGYNGADCSQRECPRGDDPLTHRPVDCGGEPCRVERQVFTITAAAGAADWVVVKFTDWTGKVWSTDRFLLAFDTVLTSTANCGEAKVLLGTGAAETAFEDFFEELLEGIPNGVLEGVDVAATSTATVLTLTVTFTDKPGNLQTLQFVRSAEMEARYGACGSADISSFVLEPTSLDGNGEESTCSNRGVCDYGTGLCKCFKGYTDDDCSTQNALAQ